jgi:Helix-turn-helix domain
MAKWNFVRHVKAPDVTQIKMKNLPKKENLRPDEVADYLDVSKTTVYREMETYVDTLGSEGLAWFTVRGQKRIKRKDVLAYCKRKPFNQQQSLFD